MTAEGRSRAGVSAWCARISEAFFPLLAMCSFSSLDAREPSRRSGDPTGAAALMASVWGAISEVNAVTRAEARGSRMTEGPLWTVLEARGGRRMPRSAWAH
jgi:hypothetical protein